MARRPGNPPASPASATLRPPKRADSRTHGVPANRALGAGIAARGTAILHPVGSDGPIQPTKAPHTEFLTLPKSTGKQTVETAYGITSHSPNTPSAERLLALNRGHWTVEATHHILDCCWDGDRCRIRTDHGPENTTRLRRFAIGVIRSQSHCVAAAVRRLNSKPRLVFDYLKMTKNTLHPKNSRLPAREQISRDDGV